MVTFDQDKISGPEFANSRHPERISCEPGLQDFERELKREIAVRLSIFRGVAQYFAVVSARSFVPHDASRTLIVLHESV